MGTSLCCRVRAPFTDGPRTPLRQEKNKLRDTPPHPPPRPRLRRARLAVNLSSLALGGQRRVIIAKRRRRVVVIDTPRWLPSARLGDFYARDCSQENKAAKRASKKPRGGRSGSQVRRAARRDIKTQFSQSVAGLPRRRRPT